MDNTEKNQALDLYRAAVAQWDFAGRDAALETLEKFGVTVNTLHGEQEKPAPKKEDTLIFSAYHFDRGGFGCKVA